MFDFRSGLTQLFRQAARVLPPENRLRKQLSAAWDQILNRTGCYVSVPLAGRTVRMKVACRHIDPNYEADTLQVWLRLVELGDTVWDVGANLGVYTILTGQAVGAGGSVIAWEPAPATFQILRDHITANGLGDWCQAIQAAVADKDGGTIRFSLLSGDEPNSMNRIAHTETGTTVDVPVGTLDGWLHRLVKPPHLGKIDIEGAEVLALRGAARLLGVGGPRPVLLVAVHPPFLAEFGCSTDDLPPLLEQYQYECRDLTGKPVRPTELAEYLFLPRERADEIVSRIRS